ncbi:MAG: permease [Bacteroidota bacterium]|nr:permease [Bacteroidota bacterium]MDP4197211.1 permease [Bacteroidota bacterium]
MYTEIYKILEFMLKAVLHIWPYLLVTIPISVAISMTGASKYINKIFTGNPNASILLAALIGAFSPFCSCGVIPVVAALLISGVPLAPVMTFWIASPSMDPEMFFLSVGMLGWNLAVWRLASTVLLSLSAGYITNYLVKREMLGKSYIRTNDYNRKIPTLTELAKRMTKAGGEILVKTFRKPDLLPIIAASAENVNTEDILSENSSCGCGGGLQIKANSNSNSYSEGAKPNGNANSCCASSQIKANSSSCCGDSQTKGNAKQCCSSESKGEDSNRVNKEPGDLSSQKCSCGKSEEKFFNKLVREVGKSTLMVSRFMLIAFFLEALIVLYVPQDLIISLMGKNNVWSVFWAALIGVPVYTSNITALPMISGLMQQGLSPAAALAFLISGPITTIPAMSAVWGITTKKVFYLYVSFAFLGALFFGYLLYFVSILL